MVFAITGGGTGGHLAIAKSLGLELKKREIKTIFIGSTYGQDKKWFENSDIFEKTYFLQSSGVVNKSGFKKIFSLFNIFKLAFTSKKILKENSVKCVISVGGYSSAPASFGAILSKIPLFLHEQNAIFGRLNKLLKPFSKHYYTSYEMPKTDYPVNEKFFSTARNRQKLETVIFLGGSQGANFINSLAKELAPKLLNSGLKVIHQCGDKSFNETFEFYQKNGLNVELVGFYADLHKLIQKADICIGRSGASTLWELCANRLPAIFIPFPFAAGDHQYYNAKFLADLNLCKIIRQDEASAEKIINLMREFEIQKVSKALEHTIYPNGASFIIDDILKRI